ncbi:unnamed protein product [Closterium sp. NIES-54]
MLRVWGCMVLYRPPTSTIGKFASRARWGIHLGISHEHKAWLILDLMGQKTTNACDVIFYKRLFLQQFREDEQANANCVYANDGHSYASPEDEAAATILEQDPRGDFKRGNHRSINNDDDDDNDSPGGGAGVLGGGGSGSGGGAAPPTPHEPESDDDDVQEVIPQHPTTAPFRDFNFSGSTLPPQRHHVSSSQRIRTKHSWDHTARSGAKRWMRKSRHLSLATPGCSSIERQSRGEGISPGNGCSA